MKPLLLALVALLSSCTPTEPGPVQEYQTAYHSATTVCILRFSEYRDLAPAQSCGEGQKRVAIGFTVQPINGDCEPAFYSLNGFRQLWGCQ